MRAALAGIFFLSGCAALLFESLWFRQALLAFGSSVWASSLVLSSFMTGVALGNAAIARFGTRIVRPLRTYALLEVAIGALGLGLVVALPDVGLLLVPLFRPLLEQDALLQPLRFVFAFVLLMGPALAMGATLPLLVGALTRRPEDFGTTLGALYGWNTLGAVVGAVAGELKLISVLGVTGTGACAAGLNALAAVGALALGRAVEGRGRTSGPTADPGERARLSPRALRLLLASFLAGGLLLALEVVWARLLLLFVGSTSAAFAVMLAVVLLGIAVGSLAASVWLRRAPHADLQAGSLACLAGAVGVLGYAGLSVPLPEEGSPRFVMLSARGLSLAVTLMLPTSAASGALFTLIGKSLNDSLRTPSRSAGLLTLVNTLGAAVGPLVGGFLLLPLLGVEGSIFALCASYGAVALLCARLDALRAARLALLPVVAFVVAVLAFPFGRMDEQYVPLVNRSMVWPGALVIARREGVTETIQITRESFLGEPFAHQLLTNGHSMSASGPVERRYMNLYVYLPAALHPQLRDALLISYGVGNTARSLTRLGSLDTIDVVDISRDILSTSELIFPDPAENPLHDPRVVTHVEDGRYFLQTSTKSFDLITAEPPPPHTGHVAYLYTQEYFQLAHDRLRRGGLVSYWLPVDHLSAPEAGSTIVAFCNVFADCSLWNGGGFQWMLVGSRGGLDPVEEPALRALWRDDTLSAELRAIGLDEPALLGALFMADADQIDAFWRIAPPVRDDFPLRIHNRISVPAIALFARFQQSAACRERFLASEWMGRLWPKALRRETLRAFAATGLYDRSVSKLTSLTPARRFALFREALEQTRSETLPLVALGVDPRKVQIAQSGRVPSPAQAAETERLRGLYDLVQRAWGEAAEHFEAAVRLGDRSGSRPLAVYAHCRAGERERVEALRDELFRPGVLDLRPEGLRQERGEGGCWAAAWDADWQPGP